VPALGSIRQQTSTGEVGRIKAFDAGTSILGDNFGPEASVEVTIDDIMWTTRCDVRSQLVKRSPSG
jgi:hypothetical protein